MTYNKFDLPGKEASWGFAFAARLKRILEDKNIKITEFARRTGLPKSTIESYLRGSTTPTYFRMTILADVLDMPIEKLTDIRPNADLFDDEDDELDDND